MNSTLYFPFLNDELGETTLNGFFIFDCGLYLPPIVEMEDSLKKAAYTEKMLRSIDAVPNDLILDKHGISSKVRALLITHAHLDHVGAVPFLGSRYPDAEIAGTPFTIEVLKGLYLDNNIPIKNKLVTYVEILFDNTSAVKIEED